MLTIGNVGVKYIGLEYVNKKEKERRRERKALVAKGTFENIAHISLVSSGRVLFHELNLSGWNSSRLNGTYEDIFKFNES